MHCIQLIQLDYFQLYVSTKKETKKKKKKKEL